MFEDLNALEEKYAQMLQQLTLPEVFNDFTRYSQISKEVAKYQSLKVSVHKINYFDGKNINYNETDLLIE